MFRSRAGWKVVALLLVLLLIRSVVATIIEVRMANGGFVTGRFICLAGWIVVLVCIGLGLEWARFTAVMVLTLGTAVAVAFLLDQPLLEARIADDHLPILRADLLVFTVSNLVIIPLLAFSRSVRSYFAKVPNVQFAAPPPPPDTLPAGSRAVLPQIRIASDEPAPKVPPSGAAEWRQVNPARSERKQR